MLEPLRIIQFRRPLLPAILIGVSASMASSEDADDKPPSRATVTANHRGYRINVTASRRVTGALLVNAELSGGPGEIRRWFCVASDQQELIPACQQCIRELCQVIDDLCQVGARG